MNGQKIRWRGDGEVRVLVVTVNVVFAIHIILPFLFVAFFMHFEGSYGLDGEEEEEEAWSVFGQEQNVSPKSDRGGIGGGRRSASMEPAMFSHSSQ